MNLSARIFLGLGLGIVTGLFFGEPARILHPLAEIYIRLMQMTVIPYMVLALITGFGQLDRGRARSLGLRAGIMVLLVWVAAAAVITALPIAFPRAESAAFFSRALVEPREPFSVPDLFFTANPFNALANAVVPAIVLFSSLLGVFLIGVDGRERVLDVLRTLNTAIERITRFVIGLTPIGIFAVAAVTAGTMDPGTLARLEVYFIAFGAGALLLTFWILPLATAALTPFTYREILGATKDALLLAFVTSNAFIVLPLLIERAKTLLRDQKLGNEESGSAAEVLIPILFNFPNAGRLLTLLFVPFAAWLAGSAFKAGDYPLLFGAGIPSYFAKAQIALPYLMDLFELPHDLFYLYIPTSIITGKFDSMVSAMNLMVFALIGAAATGGFLSRKRIDLLKVLLMAGGGLVFTVLAVRLVLGTTIDTSYHKDEALRSMHLDRSPGSEIVHHDPSAVDPALAAGGSMERIRERGTLRIGYSPGNLPFSFFNADSQLVGLDVELGHSLASTFDLTPEFVPIDWTELPRMLADGVIDVMPSMWYRPYWFSSLRLSDPYMEGTMGLVVRDDRRQEFTRVEALRRSTGLRIGVPLDHRQLAYSMKRYFGDSDVEFVTLVEPAAFFEEERPDLDGFLMPVEGGAAATLLHPRFTVVVPQPDPVRIPFAFGVAPGSDDLLALVNEWVLFAASEGTIDDAYTYWVLGEGAENTEPRWSILRNVLGYGTSGRIP